MGLKTAGVLGIVGGIILFVAIPTAIALTAAIFRIPASDILNPANYTPVGYAVLVSGIIMNAISALVLIIAGALLTSGRGRIPSAILMTVFGVLGIVFSLVAIGGILGLIGGVLGIIGGALGIVGAPKVQEAPPPLPPPPPPQ